MNTRYPILQRLGRYLTVGMLSTLIDIGLFAGLTGWLALPTLTANTFSYSAGIINGYVLNRWWTYGEGTQTASRRMLGAQFVQFALVSLMALMINNTLVLLLTPALETLTGPAQNQLLAKAAATLVGLGWNFLLNHFWTFRTQPAKGAQS